MSVVSETVFAHDWQPNLVQYFEGALFIRSKIGLTEALNNFIDDFHLFFDSAENWLK